MDESKYLEITETLKHLERNEDRKGQIKCEEAFCELERRLRNRSRIYLARESNN